MSLSIVFAVAALGASIFLLVQLDSRLWPAVATVAAAMELLTALRMVRLSISGISLPLLLSVALAAAGVALWIKVSGKQHVTAATVVGVIGVMQVMTSLLR